MRRFVMGDIHGCHDKLLACLDSVKFNYDNDTLIQLGDVVDRGVDTYMCVETLLSIKNLISIRGNHDEAWLKALKSGDIDSNMLWNQGARETSQSYTRRGIQPEIHFEFFFKQLPYYIDKDNNLFIHGGFNRHHLLEEQSELQYYWDRDLWMAAMGYKAMLRNPDNPRYPFKMKQKFNEIFIGHTPTTYWNSKEPINAANIWNVDTGSGKGGMLTIMNIDTKEFKQF